MLKREQTHEEISSDIKIILEIAEFERNFRQSKRPILHKNVLS